MYTQGDMEDDDDEDEEDEDEEIDEEEEDEEDEDDELEDLPNANAIITKKEEKKPNTIEVNFDLLIVCNK